MQVLISKVDAVPQDVKNLISQRISEFESVRHDVAKDVFLELCFCLMTANFQAEKSIRIQGEISDGFLKWDVDVLKDKLKVMGHRFWPQRAERIVEARKHIPHLVGILRDYSGHDLRMWFVNNVKGLGMKEASHFLRNIGLKDYAIIDFHIVDIMVNHGLIEPLPSKSITPRKYLEIEDKLKELGAVLGMDMAELDLYLWYLETGKVLK